MHKHSALLVDIVVAAAWILILVQYKDIRTPLQWATTLGVTILAGLISGRYRITLFAAAAAAIAVLVGPSSCNSGCEEDPLALQIVFSAIVIGGFCLVMTLGVFLRKEWRRRRFALEA
jgi:hypothetical protein